MSKQWSVGDRVKIYVPMSPWNGEIGVIAEMHVRKINGSIRYTVTTPSTPQGLYLSEGSLREPVDDAVLVRKRRR